jgi:cellulose synthase/poly-beta-1,6-N-acetylglucosamine synthase-like glycosyltransferase
LIFCKKVDGVVIHEPVSVVICARNEYENLKLNLPSVLNQDYPSFEVIVVNDCSYDKSEELLKDLCTQYSNLRYTNIPIDEKFVHGKKLALTIGIKSAKNELLLLTDADCKINSEKWISKMTQHFSDDIDIVLGYGPYSKRKGFLNKIVRTDTFFIALQYFSFSLNGFTYMGVGRNLAYKKSLFFKNKGFASHSNLLSGDDDLFVNSVAGKGNVKIEIDKETFAYSATKKTIKEWVRQKKRHLTTGSKYKLTHKFLLGTEILTRMGFYLLLIVLLCLGVSVETVMKATASKLFIQIIVFKIVQNRLDEKDLLLSSLILDFIMPVVNVGFVISNYITNNQNK